MKKSIRFDLFLLVAAILAGFALFGILLNVFMLEKYYIFKNESIMDSVASDVRWILENGQDIQGCIEDIDRDESVSITIADEKFRIQYSSFTRKKDNNRVPKEIKELILENNKNIKSVPISSVINKRDGSQSKLVYVYTHDKYYVILIKPMKGIKESSTIANEFFMIAGIITLLLGSIVVYRFAGNVTKPIIEMSKITEEISGLKFGRKLNISSKDEIGILANSINKLSVALEESIDGLKSDIEYHKLLSRHMSHEFKTPISIIKGYAEGVLFGVADNPEMREKYLKTITLECDRMEDFVKEILILSKISAKDFIMDDRSTFYVRPLLKEIEEQYSLFIESNEIKFAIACNDNIQLNGNYELILRAVSNLVSNAIHYCDENKYVGVSVTANEYVEICVFNTSVGIPENELQKIFVEFYKIDKTRRGDNLGHGLGLSIVKTIAKLHQGSITVKNVKGGVEFILRLPNQ